MIKYDFILFFLVITMFCIVYKSIEQALMFYYVLIMVKAVWTLGLDKNWWYKLLVVKFWMAANVITDNFFNHTNKPASVIISFLMVKISISRFELNDSQNDLRHCFFMWNFAIGFVFVFIEEQDQ